MCVSRLTDLAYALDNLKGNVHRNIDSAARARGAPSPSSDDFDVSVEALDWSQPHNYLQRESRPADVILAADVIWLEDLVAPLVSTIRLFCGEGCTLLLATQVSPSPPPSLSLPSHPIHANTHISMLIDCP